MNQPDDLERLCIDARRGEDPAAEDFSAVRRGVARRLGLVTALGAASTAKAGSALGAGTPLALAPAGVAGKASLASMIAVWVIAGAGAGGLTSWLVASTLAPSALTSVPLQSVGAERQSLRMSASAPTSRPVERAPVEDATPEDTRFSPGRGASSALGVRTASAGARTQPPSAGVVAEPTSAPSATTSATVLVDEARALADVQRALRDGDHARALELLGEMDARFGTGALGAERMAAQVLALCAAGRVEHGRALADRFAAVHPGSPLSNRIRAACPQRERTP